MKQQWLGILLFVFLCTTAFAEVFTPEEIRTFKSHLLENITIKGAIMASPSRQNPDYYYDWVRDSAIVMQLIESWYESKHRPEHQLMLKRYVHWSWHIQHEKETLPSQDILGEPKFYLSGKPYQEPWGRPQNDGPALRAITLTRFAEELLKQHESAYVKAHLYNGGLDPDNMGVIKMDLEYIAHHWQEPNFDLWEEVYGHHFFTAMVQRKALMEGAKLARALKDPLAANYYEAQAQALTTRIGLHEDNAQQRIKATLPPHPGPQKPQELDSAILLGALLGETEDGFMNVAHPVIQHSVDALYEHFKTLYPINGTHDGAIAFGRYASDTYDGYSTDGEGNPWFILTAAMAEYHYRQAQLFHSHQEKEAMQHHLDTGDAYLQLIKQYAGDLSLSEQINRSTGRQQGAPSLSWSYTAVLRALLARERIESHRNPVASGFAALI